MKLLLDESVPRHLASSFPKSSRMYTVQEMGWRGTGNGLLLSMAAGEDFDAFITVDRGIERQQNMRDLPPPTIMMLLALAIDCAELPPLVPGVMDVLTGHPQASIEAHGFDTKFACHITKAVREDPKNTSRPRWSDDDVTAREAARAECGPP